MAEISPLLYLEKKIDNTDISITDDYEVLKSIYPDDIKEIINNTNELYFLLKLKHEIEIQNSTIELLHSMKLDDLLNCNNDYSKEKQIIKIYCYVFWFKYEENIKKELEEKLSRDIEEPILYNIIEETKYIIEKTLKDKKMLLDLLTEIRELKVMQVHITTDNFLLNETGANDDINDDFEYKEVKLRHPSNNNENKTNKKKLRKKEQNTNKENIKEKKIDENKNNKDNNSYDYEQFFKDGGFVGETIIDRASTFQAHEIKIKNKIFYFCLLFFY